MAKSINEVNLLGNVGQDPEFFDVGGGKQAAKFTIATTETWKDKKTGEYKSMAEWHSIVVWNEYYHKMIIENIRKGSRVLVRGEINTKEYTDKNNIKRNVKQIGVKFDGFVVFVAKPPAKSDVVSEYGNPGELGEEKCLEEEFSIPF